MEVNKMEMDLSVNPINKQIDSNIEKISKSISSVEKQNEITKKDNLDYSLKAEKAESKKREITEYVKKQDFSNAINSVNEYVEMFNNKVSFSIDEKSREIIHVYDNETGELIRQIPPKEMIELVDKLEEIAGIIFNNKV
jgi:flagellar protein FlaG